MKIWLITGSSSGLGLALAKTILARGDAAVLAARKLDPLFELQELYGDRVKLFTVDVTDKSQVRQVVAETVAHFGRIDFLVNNAGRGLVGALEEFSDEQIKANFDTNFFGAVNMIRASLVHMRRQRSGTIVNISAIAGLYNEMGFSVYGAAKFALEGLSESLQSELRHLGVKVLIVEPGPLRTGFVSNSMDSCPCVIDDYKQSSGKFAEFLRRLSGKQAGDPERAAALIYEAAVCDRPPQRLLLGSYAFKRLGDKMRRLMQEAEQWKEKGEAIDFQSKPLGE